jgi:hypothetical protein
MILGERKRTRSLRLKSSRKMRSLQNMRRMRKQRNYMKKSAMRNTMKNTTKNRLRGSVKSIVSKPKSRLQLELWLPASNKTTIEGLVTLN